MKNNYSIHIPTPCHENWNAMTPVEQGRFCQSCAKEVVDFSLMTDQEVLNYFNKATGNTCGRFNNDQLQRPLQPTKMEKRKAWWVVAMMPMLLFFLKAVAQKQKATKNIIKVNESVMGLGEVVVTKISHPTDYWPVSSDEDDKLVYEPAEKCKPQLTTLTVERKKGDDDFTVSGTVINSRINEPLPYATVVIKGTKTAVATDSVGNFSIKGTTTNNQAVLSVSEVGFENTDVLVQIKDTIENISRNVTGIVVDANNNAPLSFASITVRGSKINTSTDATGKFTIKLNGAGNSALIISAVGYMDTVLKTPVADWQTNVLLDTIKLTPSMVAEESVVLIAGKVACSYDKPLKADTISTFIQKVFNKNVFKVYPNPAQSGSLVTVNIKNEGSYSLQLYASNGNLIMATPVEATKGTLQTSILIPAGLTPGMYYIKLFDNKKKKQYTDKLVIL